MAVAGAVAAPAKPGGRPLTHPRREIADAIFYIVRSGCSWRMLPKDLPPWPTVYWYFRQWAQQALWFQIHHVLREFVRCKSGRKVTPAAAILDSQTVKTGDHAGARGVDAGKKINGRKRHVLTDTLGLILLALVTPADVQDQDGAKTLLTPVLGVLRRLQVIWADTKYGVHWLVDWVKASDRTASSTWKSSPNPPDKKAFRSCPKGGLGSARLGGWSNRAAWCATMRSGPITVRPSFISRCSG